MIFRRRAPDLRAPLIRRVKELELVSARLIRAGFAGDYRRFVLTSVSIMRCAPEPVHT